MMYLDNHQECFEYLTRACNQGRPVLPDATVHYCNVLWYFAELVQATTALEIGIGPDQCSGMTFVYSLAKRPGSKLISYDIDRGLPYPNNKHHAKTLGVEWVQHYGDSISADVQVVPDVVDILYIDGDHDHAHAYGDFKKFWDSLRDGGYCIVDDWGAFGGVNTAMAALDQEGFHALWVKHDAVNGRGVIRKGANP